MTELNTTSVKKITVALAGNPNSGKTTIFNSLTGARQHVANYPGVTVEKIEGVCQYEGYTLHIVDLPGTYSLSARSIEELIARRFVVEERPDVVVQVADASNLERNLYLGVQFMELKVPLVIALNMSDLARAQGIEFDLAQLSRLLGCPLVPTVGHKGIGTKELLEAVVGVATGRIKVKSPTISYGPEIDSELERLSEQAERFEPELSKRYGARWVALKLLENDLDVRRRVNSRELLEAAAASSAYLRRILGESPEIVIADCRYGFITGACQEAVRASAEYRRTISDSIDAVLTHRVLGIPVFLALMYLVFYITFTAGEPAVRFLEQTVGYIADLVSSFWPAGSESAFRSFLVDGVIGGVGAVVVFLPNILLLFLAISILEDSGYMARAAFIMDKVMHKVGLHGQSFIPMLIGFGCSVPAIMATRTLADHRDRLTTMFIIPLMSCGARLTIYALFIPAFFPQHLQAPMLWIIYIIGIALAVLGAKLLKSLVFRGESTPFVMELPPYRMPTLRGIFLHMWRRARAYLQKAGTVILGVSVILWFLSSYPKPPEEIIRNAPPESAKRLALENSFVGRFGRIIEPALKPMGFDWRIGTALIGAFAAKEVFVAQMAVVFAKGGQKEGAESLRKALRSHYTPLVAFCIMLFCLIAFPCMATLAVMRKESGSWKWPILQELSLTAAAFVLTAAVYQLGTLLGIGTKVLG